MKKITLTLVAVICALCCVLGLAACGDDDNADGGKVTAEKWSAGFTAFATADNYSVEMGNNLLEFDGTKFHAKIGENEVIVAKDGNNYYQYLKEGANGAWTKESMTEQDFTNGINLYKTRVLSLVGLLKDDYDSLTFKDGKYSASLIDKTADVGGELRDVVVVFKNNKLSSITFKADLDEPNGTYTLKNVGSTSVKLPAAVEASAKMTEQEWQAMLTAFASAKNFSLQMSVNDNEVGTMMLCGATYYDVVDGVERIFVKNGSNYTKYNRANANADWTAANIDEAEYNRNVKQNACDLVDAAALAFGQAYESFTSSHVNGKYTATTLTVAQGFVLNDIEVTVKSGALVNVECTWVGTPDKRVTVNYVGNTEIEIPSAVPAPQGKVVTADQWKSILTETDNFTLNMEPQTMMFDGVSFWVSPADGVDTVQLITKDGDNYYMYYRNNQGAWERSTTTQEIYQQILLQPKTIISLFADDFDSFTYADGKYTCAFLDKVSDCTDIAVVFENGKLVSIAWTMEGKECQIEKVGATEIKPPAEYTESNNE